MTDNHMHFIKTSDQQTADMLRAEGLMFLHEDNGKFVFVIDTERISRFSDLKNCYITSKLTF